MSSHSQVKKRKVMEEIKEDLTYKTLSVTSEEFSNNIPQHVHRSIARALLFGVDKLLGDVLTIIETLGLPERQEKALKTQIKRAYYERYGATSDELMHVVLALDRILTPNEATGWSVFTPHQNQSITGYDSLPEIE